MAEHKFEIGPDIDLDEEVVLDGRSKRITEAVAEQWGEEAARSVDGRPPFDQSHGPH